MPRISLLAQLVPLLALFLTSCTSSSLEVRKGADPNPFVGADAFTLESIQYVDLQVDGVPEADYVAELDAEAKAEWDNDKGQRLYQVMLEAAQDAAGGGLEITAEGSGRESFRIRPVVTEIESGYYRIPAWNAVTRIFITFEILDSDGTVADELYGHDAEAFDAMFNPTISGRMGSVAKSLGRMLGDYLKVRVGT